MLKPKCMRDCSVNCPAIGDLYEELTELDEGRRWWRMYAIASLILNALLVYELFYF